MIAKIIGAFLLVIGIVFGLKIVWSALGFIFSAVTFLIGSVVVGGVVYCGWRLINKS